MSAILAPTPLVPPSSAVGWPRRVPAFLGERWTIEEVYAIPHPERYEGRRLFLLRGEIWEQGMANVPHDAAVYCATETLRQVFATGFVVRCQLGMRLADDTEVIPDLLVAAGARRTFATAHPTTADLIVEVSDTTLFFDTTTKAELYATAGVPEYWVLDVNARTLLVLRDPAPVNGNGHAYRSSRTLTEADTVTPLATPHATLRVADLLP